MQVGTTKPAKKTDETTAQNLKAQEDGIIQLVSTYKHNYLRILIQIAMQTKSSSDAEPKDWTAKMPTEHEHRGLEVSTSLGVYVATFSFIP